LVARLQRPEQDAGAARCPTCRERLGRAALRIGRKTRDDSVLSQSGEDPRPYERWGEVPEQVLTIVEAVVRSREESLASASVPAIPRCGRDR
jgi:hypothetical protein